MSFQDFAKVRCYYNGRKIDMITSAQMTTDSGQQPVNVLEAGMVGFTPGSGHVQMQIGYVVPRDGSEEAFQQDCANGRNVVFQFGRGDVDYTGVGKILTTEEGQSTGETFAGTFTWMGKLGPMR